MRSRIILNLALLVVVAILGALAFFEPFKKKPESIPIATVDENALTTLTLKNKDTITFEKKDGHWRLVAPFAAPANDTRVRQLIDIAKANSDARYPLKPEDRAKFGLDKPKASLVLGSTTLVFGDSDPINMRRYVEVGDTLHLVNDDFFHHLTAAATDYVDKKLLPENAKVKEIVIPGLKAVLGPDGKWTREPPGDGKPDLGELATLWSTARAIEVKRLEKPAQGDPVRIGLAEGGPVEFVIVQREPDVILARPALGLTYELTGDTARQLLNLPKAAPPAPPPGNAPQPPENGDDEGNGAAEDDKDDGPEDDSSADEKGSSNTATPAAGQEGGQGSPARDE
ncbi:DUF4340 domain-containing protein [Candidatus Methylocalor cossyra]|uniref:DUF4340 domain-containing protein n=1 Tax=Candidatus Methylocalor cossyra TaxID=3108543 RepID=A0ABM9NE41_9GAMM